MLVEDEFGNKYYKQVYGYHPIFYYMVGVTLSSGPLGVYLHNILDSIFLHTTSLTFNLFGFLASIVVGCILLSPDVCNKFLPFELKTFEGLKKFVFLSIFIIAVLLLMEGNFG